MPARNDDLRDALKRAASALQARKDRSSPWRGSYALWVFGGPEPVHDVDFVVAEADTEQAAADAGGGRLQHRAHRRRTGCSRRASATTSSIDVLHRLNGVPVDAGTIRPPRSSTCSRSGCGCLPPTHVVTEKLNSLNEHHCDFASLLPARARGPRTAGLAPACVPTTADNDFAAAFLFLADRLGLTLTGG